MTDIEKLWYVLNWTSGKWPQILQELHKKHGDVVRVATNELSFASAQSYKDIYGHASKDRTTFLKGPSYIRPTKYPSIVHANGEAHRKQRKALAHAFSAQALRDQENIVTKYVDIFAAQLGEWSTARPTGVDIVEAFNWITFDIIGDLAFGESFKAVETGKTHPWVSIILDTIRQTNVVSLRGRFPWITPLVPFLVPRDLPGKLAYHKKQTAEMTARRIKRQDSITHADFFQRILEKGEFEEESLRENANVLIVAGSETTATTLSGVTYHLLHNENMLKKLQDEVRTAFSSPEEITGDSTQHLLYLHACLEEALRIYPPVAAALQRVSPGATVDGHWVPAGTLCGNETWSVMRDERYWKDPNTFRPERWLNGEVINKDAFNPFSLGPRVCIGINLAYMEMHIILARIVWQYDWELVSKELDWERENKMYVLWNKPELNMKFHPRKDTEVNAMKA